MIVCSVVDRQLIVRLSIVDSSFGCRSLIEVAMVTL